MSSPVVSGPEGSESAKRAANRSPAYGPAILRMVGRIVVVAVALLIAPPVIAPTATGSAGTARAATDALITLTGSRTIDLATGKAVNLALPREAGEVLVADPKVAEVVVKSPTRVFLIGLKPGDTNVFLTDPAGGHIATLTLHVTRDLGALRDGLATLSPKHRIAAKAVNESIILSGEVPSAEIAESARQLAIQFADQERNVVSMLRITHPEQVLIQIKVTEMRRSIAKRLGVNLVGTGDRFNVRSGVLLDGTLLFEDTFTRAAVGGPVGSTGFLSAALEALEEDGYVKTLAEPNLTAMSGESANFLAGGEFPIPVGRDRDGQVTIEFKPFGVGLKFTPVVLDGGRISMRISTEVSDITDRASEGALVLSEFRVPALTVRRAETTVEIPSGGGLVLGGLLRNDAVNETRGLPGMASLPIIGQLFRSDDFRRQETELVVIAVPYIVRPTSPSRLSGSVDGFSTPSDMERIFLGRLYSRYPGGAGKPAVKGPIGFILE